MHCLYLLIMLTLGSQAAVQPRTAFVDYGRAERGVFVWIGGDTLPSRPHFYGDPANGQVYAVDASGQRYPLFIDEPRTLVIDSARVDRLAPGLLNPAAARRREQVLRRLAAINDSLITLGHPPNVVAIVLQRELQGRPEIESVSVNGRTLSYYWRGWSVASTYTAGRRLPVLSTTAQFQNYAENIMTHLQNGEMVVMGYNGMYTVVPSRKIGLFRAEIERLRLGQQSEAHLLTNKLISGPIMLRRPTVEWLKQANREE